VQPVPDTDLVLRWCRAGLDGLAVAREEIDALNVYPVPDRDTGTNLYVTMESAVAAAEARPADNLADVAVALAHGGLVGARGNSGIILAQMLRGVADVLALPAGATTGAETLARALTRAAESAYRCVAEPTEGTILSVAREAAAAASARAHRPYAGVPEVARAAAEAGHDALSRTPDQLEVLRAAGVVDAGGRGLTVLLDALDTVLTGRRPLPVPRRVGQHRPLPAPRPPSRAGGAGRPDTGAARAPAFEVMFLLDAPHEAIASLRADLAGLGESSAVVGGDGEWNVHVHVDDAGAAIEAGVRAGRPHHISITPLLPSRLPERVGRAVVALAAGGGLAELFAAAGAVIVPTPTAHRPTTADLIGVIDLDTVAELVLLPNEPDAVPVAEAAAAEARSVGVRAAVVPAVAQVQGLAALAVHEPSRAFDADVVAMTAAAGHTRHGAVTVATREAMTMAGVCKPGDVLGVVDGDFALIGSDLGDVACNVVTRMLAAGGELVTVVTGADADQRLARRVVSAATAAHPEVDTVVYAGGQPRYPLLLGVE
jgi:hypothetical protein